jgi:ELWxxDGT repeat protein
MKSHLLSSAILLMFILPARSHAQMTRVADICAGACSSNLASPALFNGKVYFQANSASAGFEVWEYDGTNAPTLLLDINSGAASSSPKDFLVYNSKLYFSADDGTNGRQLWVYDGINPPSMVYNFGVNFTNFRVLQTTLYILANNNVWSYTGTGSPSSVANLGTFGITGGEIIGATTTNIYFTASTAASGNEVWRYTGSGLPTILDINPGTGSSVISNAAAALGNALYFFANNGTNGDELFMHNGTGSASLVSDINTSGNGASGTGGIAVFNSNIYFRANDGTNGNEVWKYDGTNAPTMLMNINTGAANADPAWFAVINNVLYFNATDATHGAELWKYDGTNNPTLVEDVVAGTGSLSPQWIFEFNSKVYMRGDGNDGSGAELWLYIPATDSTPPVVTFDPSNNSTGIAIISLITLTFDEPIRLLNDDPIQNTDVANLIEFRLNNATGALVSFTGTFNGTANEMVITPDAALLNGQVYYVALKANGIEDASNNAITALQSSSFTTEVITSTTSVQLNESFTLYPNPVAAGERLFSDKSIEKVSVMNARGIQLYQSTSLRSIDTPGLYYVEFEVEGKRFMQKIIVQ